MNATLERTARDLLKQGLAQCTAEERRVFALMYGRDQGRRSVDDAVAMSSDAIVDEMPADRLDWALSQVERTLAKAGR